jgi:hypothetical protein
LPKEVDCGTNTIIKPMAYRLACSMSASVMYFFT